jgi:CheY-like chemotaxis protein
MASKARNAKGKVYHKECHTQTLIFVTVCMTKIMITVNHLQSLISTRYMIMGEENNWRFFMPIKALAIDDDPAMTELLALLLKSHGLEVFTANSGNEGLQLVRAADPDIIILDLMMPGVDGWQVCREIRTFSKVPIIVLSALDNPGMVASALDAGADDYLIKPVPSGVLIAHLNNLTRRANVQNNGIDMRKHTSPFLTPPPVNA